MSKPVGSSSSTGSQPLPRLGSVKHLKDFFEDKNAKVFSDAIRTQQKRVELNFSQASSATSPRGNYQSGSPPPAPPPPKEKKGLFSPGFSRKINPFAKKEKAQLSNGGSSNATHAGSNNSNSSNTSHSSTSKEEIRKEKSSKTKKDKRSPATSWSSSSSSSLMSQPSHQSHQSQHLGDSHDSDSIGTPFNVVHKGHVDLNFSWSGKPEEVFSLEEKLGQGAFGTVYRGLHRESGFEVAIKVLPKEDEDIEKEIDLMRGMRNPSVVSYFGTCKTEDSLWILLDYCNLGSIRDLMETLDQTLDESQIAHICRNTLKGLVYLHANKIVHRDLKAANIMLNSSGDVKLADFGISAKMEKEPDRHSKYIKLDDCIGSPYWMAPEVILEEDYDAKADIWSLGITVIEMADGGPPLAHLPPMVAMHKIPDNQPPSLKEATKWSTELNDFISCCLVKDPSARPTASQLLVHPFLVAGAAMALANSGKNVLAPLVEEYDRARKQRLALEKQQEKPIGKQSPQKPLASACAVTRPEESEGESSFGTFVCHKKDVESDSDSNGSGPFDTFVAKPKTSSPEKSSPGTNSGNSVFALPSTSDSDSDNQFGTFVIKKAETFGQRQEQQEAPIFASINELKQLRSDFEAFKMTVVNELASQKMLIEQILSKLNSK